MVLYVTLSPTNLIASVGNCVHKAFVFLSAMQKRTEFGTDDDMLWTHATCIETFGIMNHILK